MGQTGQDWTWNRASVASPRVGHSPLHPMTLLANSSYNDKVGSFPCCSVPSGGSGAGGTPHLLLGQSEGNCLVLWSDSKSQSPSVIPEHRGSRVQMQRDERINQMFAKGFPAGLYAER